MSRRETLNLHFAFSSCVNSLEGFSFTQGVFRICNPRKQVKNLLFQTDFAAPQIRLLVIAYCQPPFWKGMAQKPGLIELKGVAKLKSSERRVH